MVIIAGIPYPVTVGVKPPSPVQEYADLIFAIVIPVSGYGLDAR